MLVLHTEIQRRFRLLSPFLDERMRRLVTAAESEAIGYGGVTAVARATGVSRRAITEGMKELSQRKTARKMPPAQSRVRREGAGRKRTVDIAVESVSFDLDLGHLLIGYLHSRWIHVFIEIASHGQACFRGCCGDEVDNHLVADQRLAPPVLTNKREQSVFDLVPFARARREVTNRNCESGFL